jgi:hypothetical protein
MALLAVARPAAKASAGQNAFLIVISRGSSVSDTVAAEVRLAAMIQRK